MAHSGQPRKPASTGPANEASAVMPTSCSGTCCRASNRLDREVTIVVSRLLSEGEWVPNRKAGGGVLNPLHPKQCRRGLPGSTSHLASTMDCGFVTANQDEILGNFRGRGVLPAPHRACAAR